MSLLAVGVGATGTPPSPSTEVLAAESGGTLGAIEDAINNTFNPVSEAVTNFVFADFNTLFGGADIPVIGDFPWIVLWLVVAAAIFTVYFGFVQFRKFGLAVKIVRGKYTRNDEPGEITHFQALTSAVSGTVGLGNIAGVGVAMTVGGAGATFWMILAGLLGMCTKFVECTLGVRYREYHEDGTVSGGPMHYLRRGLGSRAPSAPRSARSSPCSPRSSC